MKTREEIKRLRFKIKKIVSDLNRVVSELYNAELLSSPEKKEEVDISVCEKHRINGCEACTRNGDVFTFGGVEKQETTQELFTQKELKILLDWFDAQSEINGLTKYDDKTNDYIDDTAQLKLKSKIEKLLK